MSTPVSMVQVCTEFDSSGTCTASAWMPYGGTGVLGTLSIEDAETIAGAIALLWVTAFVIRFVRRALNL